MCEREKVIEKSVCEREGERERRKHRKVAGVPKKRMRSKMNMGREEEGKNRRMEVGSEISGSYLRWL